MCLFSTLQKNKKYTKTKKNKGIVPKCDDKRKLYVAVGCGRCIECLKAERTKWQIRMAEEIERDKTGKFVTMTFSPEGLKRVEYKTKSTEANAVATMAVKLFRERWRRKFKKSIKHWLITELGHEGTERLHMHGILFTEESNETIKERWGYGNVWIGDYVNERTINYTIKYITKVDQDHKGYKPKVLTSPGMGKGFTEGHNWDRHKYREDGTRDHYRNKKGFKIGMPIYYRNKRYSEEEKEKLWMEMLDKKERFVMGHKIDVSTKEGIKEYFDAVKYAQKKNDQLGYGNKYWDKKTYETEKKIINNLED